MRQARAVASAAGQARIVQFEEIEMSEARDDTDWGPEFEERQQSLDPHRAEERAAVTAEVASRLRARGVLLTGEETSEQIVSVLEAVERFERAVEARGGDLMVDTRPAREPDNPDFVLPQRSADESISAYVSRIEDATERVESAEPDR